MQRARPGSQPDVEVIAAEVVAVEPEKIGELWVEAGLRIRLEYLIVDGRAVEVDGKVIHARCVGRVTNPGAGGVFSESNYCGD